MMTSRSLLLAMLVLILAACKSVESVPHNYFLNPQSDKGVLVSSLTYHGSYSGYSILFRKVGSDDFNQLTIGTGTALLPPGMLDWDIKQRGLRGNVFAVELPVGDYEIFSWRVSSGYAHVRPQNDFRIPFSITPGKAIYLGNFNFERKLGLGGTVTAVDVTYGDEANRDITILQRKYTGIDSAKVSAALDNQQLGHGLGGYSSATITIPIIIPAR